ncbi:MAG TPA: 23S rRNA (adenine(2030)-N(6))-methyltransferase RlmJ [Rhizomicrobium sp.]
MNYRHGYHAGNFADVVKHVALVQLLLHLRKKDTAFSVIDSHAGRGLYDLAGVEAGKTGEAANGIGRLAGLAGALPETVATYLALVRESGGYPGSPLLAAKLLRPQDRLTALEKHPEEYAVLKQVLAPFQNAVAENGDGYARAVKLVPPPSRRGLVVIDPPFEAADEFAALVRALREGYRKFANGIFLAWYPIKSRAEADGFTGEILAAGVAKALTVEASIAAPEGKLARAGLLVINPSWGFADAFAPLAAPLDADIQIKWLAGAE